MPIFGDSTSPYDECVEKVTAETLTSENWALMIDICDRVSADGQRGCKQCLLSVKKRLNNRDPHVILLALALLDCLWNNCGAVFRREVSSKEFISELKYKATNSNRIISEKAREIIRKWTDNECKKDGSLSLVESLYKDLSASGYSFDIVSAQKKKTPMISNDPNVVHSEQEEADIAKAIALSLEGLKVDGNKQSQNTYPSLQDTFPKFNNNESPSQITNTVRRQVRALYDFEAAEDNELSFSTGEIVCVLDDSDQNWWRGTTARGIGLFPASFVTSDLSDPVAVQMKEEKPVEPEPEPPRVQIDENILLKCIQLLEDCDPTASASTDPPDLVFYEHISMAQAPLIDNKLAAIDKQHNMLAQIDLAIRDVLANYDNAVQQVQYQMQQHYGTMPVGGGSGGLTYQPTQSQASVILSTPSQVQPIPAQAQLFQQQQSPMVAIPQQEMPHSTVAQTQQYFPGTIGLMIRSLFHSNKHNSNKVKQIAELCNVQFIRLCYPNLVFSSQLLDFVPISSMVRIRIQSKKDILKSKTSFN